MINLKSKAVEANITQRYLAARFKVTDGCMSQWLSRKNPVPDKYKRELAKLLGVTVEDLLPETQPNGEP